MDPRAVNSHWWAVWVLGEERKQRAQVRIQRGVVQRHEYLKLCSCRTNDLLTQTHSSAWEARAQRDRLVFIVHACVSCGAQNPFVWWQRVNVRVCSAIVAAYDRRVNNWRVKARLAVDSGENLSEEQGCAKLHILVIQHSWDVWMLQCYASCPTGICFFPPISILSIVWHNMTIWNNIMLCKVI